MKHVISLSVFLLLGIVVWWSITTNYSDNNQLSPPKSKEYAEIFMNEFEMIAMNENGQPGYRLNGTYMQRNAGSDDTVIQQPVFLLLQENKQWKVTADEAIVNNENETIQLKSNVVMLQLNTEPAVTIRTQYLQIHTRTQIAQTKALVHLTQGNSRIRSDGMVFDNNNSELKLSANVNGYFLPHE